MEFTIQIFGSRYVAECLRDINTEKGEFVDRNAGIGDLFLSFTIHLKNETNSCIYRTPHYHLSTAQNLLHDNPFFDVYYCIVSKILFLSEHLRQVDSSRLPYNFPSDLSRAY